VPRKATGVVAAGVVTVVHAARLMGGDADGPTTNGSSLPRSTATANERSTRQSAPTATRTVPTRAPTAPARLRSDCDHSYPDACIPSAPPDLDCGDVGVRRFAVRPPDPHNFDADSDGTGSNNEATGPGEFPRPDSCG